MPTDQFVARKLMGICRSNLLSSWPLSSSRSGNVTSQTFGCRFELMIGTVLWFAPPRQIALR